MRRARFQAATDFLIRHQHLIQLRERPYKLRGAEQLRAHLGAFRTGELDQPVHVNAGNALDILDWRVIEAVNALAAAHPDAFRRALDALWAEPLQARRADAFWAAIDPALSRIPTGVAKAVHGLGTRASVASYFLFLADPARFPFYRPHFGGKAMEYLYDRTEALDTASPSALLHDYGSRATYLLREFRDAGLPLQDQLDLQSALYVLIQDYVNKGEPKTDISPQEAPDAQAE